MDDVAAVAPPVPAHERGERGRPGTVSERLPGACPPRELEDDRREHERRERVPDEAGRARAAARDRERRSDDERDGAAGPRSDAPSARKDARRHATSGPIPISRMSGSPKTIAKKS